MSHQTREPSQPSQHLASHWLCATRCFEWENRETSQHSHDLRESFFFSLSRTQSERRFLGLSPTPGYVGYFCRIPMRRQRLMCSRLPATRRLGWLRLPRRRPQRGMD